MWKIIKALGYSLSGLKATLLSERAFRQELIMLVVLVPIVFIVPVSWLAKALMMSSLFIILIAELINTAIEAVVDRISDEHHALSKKAKDVGSAAVLLAFINAGGMLLSLICCGTVTRLIIKYRVRSAA